MCRNQLVLGASLIAGGAGIVLSLLLGSAFLSILFAVGLILGGVLLLSGSA